MTTLDNAWRGGVLLNPRTALQDLIARVFSPGFAKIFRPAFDPGAAAAAAVPWYLASGVPAANCIAAYAAKGAAGLAASYDNLAAPGNGLADGTYEDRKSVV